MTTHLAPATHRNDPRTSLEAELEVTVTGQRQRHIDMVVASVREYPGLTAEEYGALTGLGRIETARRLSDAKEAWLVRRGERKVYPAVGGTSQSTWYPVTAEPVQIGMPL